MKCVRRFCLATTAAAAVLLSLTSTPALAQDGSKTCPAGDGSDPLATANFSQPALARCVRQRCRATTGREPATVTNAYCDGDATSEAGTQCEILLGAYTSYYACALSALVETDPAVQTSLATFLSTPGYPARLSIAGCYSCNNFATVISDITSTCAWDCDSCCGQGLAGRRFRDKDYAYVLCGKACTASILVACMTVALFFSFVMCGLMWPGPSLKSTAARVAAESHKEAAARSSSSGNEHKSSNPEEEEAAPESHEPTNEEAPEDKSNH